MKKIWVLALLCLSTFNANAYLITVFNDSKINYSSPSRILVTGAGDDLGTQFQQVAKAKALKYQEHFPNDQIILITHEETELGNNIVTLKNLGFNLIKNNKSNFNGAAFINDIKNFTAINSIDIFSHSSAQYGIHLDSRLHRLTTNTDGLLKLDGHFSKNAFVILHGCNAGFTLAPYLSSLWNVPVAGAMTSTHFQKLHSDGEFYLNEENSYPNSDWSTINKQSFIQPVACQDGGCLRLKPDNFPYIGFWGEYKNGGLPFYKFFCVNNTEEQCLKAMTTSLLSFTSTTNIRKNASLAEYKKVVFDYLCPISSTKDVRSECEANLENALISGDESYNPFSRKQVQCDFISCDMEIKCKKLLISGAFKPGSCTLINNYNGNATTLVREYKAYLKAYQYLGEN